MASVVHMHAGAVLACGQMPLGGMLYNIAAHTQICTCWICDIRLSTDMLSYPPQPRCPTNKVFPVDLPAEASNFRQQLMKHFNGRLMICRASHWRCSGELGKKRKKRPTTAEAGSQVGSDAC